MDTLSTHRDSLENRVDNLLKLEVLEAFDRTAFEHDGYWVWEGILTDAARQQWTASLQKFTTDERCDPHGYGVECYRL